MAPKPDRRRHRETPRGGPPRLTGDDGPARIALPQPALVALIGSSGSGKSTFAHTHFKPTEILTSDHFRALVSDDETDQTATDAAFRVLYALADERLRLGRLTVIDATNVQIPARANVLQLARRHHCVPVAIVLDLPEFTLRARNAARTDRRVPDFVITRHVKALHGSISRLEREGFRHVYHLSGESAIAAAVIERTALPVARPDLRGPFDIIGDLHNCAAEFDALLDRLGWEPPDASGARRHPAGRTAVLVGDLLDRGPDPVGVLNRVMAMVAAGTALAVLGNHDRRLVRVLAGRPADRDHGLAETLAGWEAQPAEWRARALAFVEGLPNHLVLDDGRLVVAHAGLPEAMHGRDSAEVHRFALHGAPTDERDAEGLPIRPVWADTYRGAALVVHGHVAVPRPVRLNGTLNIDTGCVYGGDLTAFRYPERQLVSVSAARAYTPPSAAFAAALAAASAPIEVSSADPAGSASHITADAAATPTLPTADTDTDTDAIAAPSAAPTAHTPPAAVWSPGSMPGVLAATPARSVSGVSSAQQASDALLDLSDLLELRGVETRLMGRIGLRPEGVAAGIEVMTRFAIDPRWLITLPPTMAPPETSSRPGLLEHPDEAFAAYRAAGLDRVVVEAKHMGSRCLAVVCRSAAAAAARFGVDDGRTGAAFTRTGRAFFADAALEAAFLARIAAAAEKAGLFADLATDWLALDGELMPWSAKALSLLREQYADVGAATRAAFGGVLPLLAAAHARGVADIEPLLTRHTARAEAADRFIAAYRRYCWPTDDLTGLQYAPFHLLASEGAVHDDRDHAWHLAIGQRLADADATPLLRPTPHRHVDLTDPASCAEAIAWWEKLTTGGAEGMVVKPPTLAQRNERGLIQPGIKVRGPEYLSLIYGPEYRLPENFARLRQRATGRKRGLALREFALGIEALDRFVAHDPLYRVHTAVVALLALESEPLDPRL